MVKTTRIEEEFEFPSGVTASLTNKILTIKGKLGSITKDFTHAKKVEINLLDNVLYLAADFPRKNTIALIFTIKNLVKNMVEGVLEGYTYKMKIV